jgi:hypothetical protein
LAYAWAGIHEKPATEPARLPRGLRRRVYRELGATGIAVAEDAPAELGISLAISSGAARHLIAEAIDLVHRLPAPGPPSSTAGWRPGWGRRSPDSPPT